MIWYASGGAGRTRPFALFVEPPRPRPSGPVILPTAPQIAQYFKNEAAQPARASDPTIGMLEVLALLSLHAARPPARPPAWLPACLPACQPASGQQRSNSRAGRPHAC